MRGSLWAGCSLGLAGALALAILAGCALREGRTQDPLAALVREGGWRGELAGGLRGDAEFRGRLAGRALRLRWRREEVLSILPAGYERRPTDRGNPRGGGGGRFVLGTEGLEHFEPARARRSERHFLEVEVEASVGAAGLLVPLAGVRHPPKQPAGIPFFLARRFYLFSEEPGRVLALLARPRAQEALRALAYGRPRLGPLPFWEEKVFPSVLMRPDRVRVGRALWGAERTGSLVEYVHRVAAFAQALEAAPQKGSPSGRPLGVPRKGRPLTPSRQQLP
ncbi:MAG: hypothetical protein ACE5JJ_06565 [Nitrospinota bacterium]